MLQNGKPYYFLPKFVDKLKDFVEDLCAEVLDNCKLYNMTFKKQKVTVARTTLSGVPADMLVTQTTQNSVPAPTPSATGSAYTLGVTFAFGNGFNTTYLEVISKQGKDAAAAFAEMNPSERGPKLDAMSPQHRAAALEYMAPAAAKALLDAMQPDKRASVDQEWADLKRRKDTSTPDLLSVSGTFNRVSRHYEIDISTTVSWSNFLGISGLTLGNLHMKGTITLGNAGQKSLTISADVTIGSLPTFKLTGSITKSSCKTDVYFSVH